MSPAVPSPEPSADRLALIDPSRVAAVVPAWNETGKIGDVVRKVPRRWAATVIVVDDHSSDDTAGEARAAGAEVVIRHEVNKGVGAGIRTGLLEAKRRGIEYAAILSGDDQHEPDELPRVLVPLFAGEADLVQGSRCRAGRRRASRPTGAGSPGSTRCCSGSRAGTRSPTARTDSARSA